MSTPRTHLLHMVRLVLVVSTTFLIVVAHRSTDRVLAQTVEFTVRPIEESNVVLVNNPVHARDADEYSSAGGAWGRVCHTDCTNPVTATATWQRFPGGYKPLRLEVKWNLGAYMALYGADPPQ